jgi:hypothetical protein
MRDRLQSLANRPNARQVVFEEPRESSLESPKNGGLRCMETASNFAEKHQAQMQFGG